MAASALACVEAASKSVSVVQGRSEHESFHVYFRAQLEALAARRMTEFKAHVGTRVGFDDEAEDETVKALTREEAQALRARHPPGSPWRVVATQVAIGAVVAALAWLFTGEREVVWSALYGAATAAVPGALMARGMTSRLSRTSPAASAVSVMWWSMVKIGVSVLMLLLAPRLVQSLSWPALLTALVLCIQAYWLALLWRGH